MDGTVTHTKRTVKQWMRIAPGIVFVVMGVYCLISDSEVNGVDQLATVFKENGITVNEPNK